MDKIKKIKFNSLQILTIGFAVLIFLGGVLLTLPISSRNGESIPFINAIFTSASATCVTGLVVYDTYTQFTLFGQSVIIILIQIGGLGFVTVAILFSMLIGKRIGLRERSLLMEAVSTLQIGGIVKLARRVLIGTAIIETTGAVLLSFRFCPTLGLARGIWFSIFHSISAFCNAGFDLMGYYEQFSSLTLFQNDYLINITIMLLIIIGGIGFMVWNDVAEKRHHFSKYALHSKIMITGTITLILIAAILFFFSEKNHAFAGMNLHERILASFFQSVTPRTAGFNTVVLSELSDGGTLLTTILMFIGAGPGSTGGGIKVSSFVVILLTIFASTMKHNDLNIFKRRLEDNVLKRVVGNVALYLMICITGMYILNLQGFTIVESMFEAFSAIGTVGLSMGITPTLPALSKIVITILMYSGRVGSISVAMAVAEFRDKSTLKNPIEKIIV